MRDNNIKLWTETSAKSGEYVEELFLNASKFLFAGMLDGTESSSVDNGQSNNEGSHMGSHGPLSPGGLQG